MAHIPDGFLSAPVAVGTLVTAGTLTAYAARRARRGLDDRTAPVLGLATAAVFAAQMVNFPVAAGTSGHLLGGVLVAAIVGPWTGYLVMTAVIIAQALLFGDGGLTALGANVLNIGGLGALLGYAVYRGLGLLAGDGPRARGVSAAAAAYLVTVLTGLAAGLQLGLSGAAPIPLSLAAMGTVYAAIGIVEAGVTGLAVWALARRGAGALYQGRRRGAGRAIRGGVLAGLGGATILAGIVSLVASAAPDGLERVALDLGFASQAASWYGAPFSGYRAVLPEPAGTALAGVLGVSLLFAGTMALIRAVGWRVQGGEIG